MTEKLATSAATERFRNRFPEISDDFYRKAQDLTLSSIGIGTYLGNHDTQTDEDYANAVVRYVELGGNVIDTAANYRFQRSERNIGKALEKLAEKGFGRDEILICTKGGYLPFDGEPPRNVQAYFEENFIKKGIANFEDIIGGSHIMTPKYLQSQLDQSLENMHIDAIDVFYIHNPESQLSEVDKYSFEAKLAKAFEMLEQNRAAGKLQFYGVATWNGFRLSPQDSGFHSLERMVNIAKKIGGDEHGFRFIQLPFNMVMPEGLVFLNQQCAGKLLSTFAAAKELGVSVMASASILQGRLTKGLPENIREKMGNLPTDALTAIQFTRSAENLTTALIGMSKTYHAEENMAIANVKPAGAEDYEKLFAGAK
ncbi:MAG TPA: aldo/keto reductase [Pyrinomonadaceae bacterium]|nr:aldo/keto reductase [Pyrinomonadaceae bacterium]